MGGYASQLTPKQRWQVIHYIKVQQGKKGNGTEMASKPTKAMAAADSTAAAK
jgi:hypothetical protein